MVNPKPTVTILIPAFNEVTRIGHVLKNIIDLTWVKQIIVVDDASTDQTSKIIEKNFPKVKLIKLPKNLGKSAAIKIGLQQIKTDWIFLMDADLHNFMTKDITNAWKKLQSQPHLSQLILAIETDPPLWQKFKLNVIMSGQRFISTKFLTKFFNQRQAENYDLEIIFTDWSLDQNLATGWTPFKVLNYTKLQKWPWWQAIPKSLSFYGKWLQPSFLAVLIKQISQLTNQLS